LYDFGIPIHCGHTVSRIIGKQKIEAVEISKLDQDMKPVKGTEEIIECDCLVLSVGLIPENEVAETAGVKLDPKSNGTITDECLQTSVAGIFSCGNSRRIMDLADFVSEQGELAGRNAVAFIDGSEMNSWDEARSTSMTKGFPEPDTVTCTVCPNGCQVRYSDGRYEGNRCPRGEKFAEQERTAPKRVLTTTVKMADGRLLPVKTERPVDKSILARGVKELKENAGSCGLFKGSAGTDGRKHVHCGDRITTMHDGGGDMVDIIAAASVQY
jgi:CxxC motif-containing protein